MKTQAHLIGHHHITSIYEVKAAKLLLAEKLTTLKQTATTPQHTTLYPLFVPQLP